MSKSIISALLLATIMFSGTNAWADKPPSLSVPDTHSIEVKGKINLYRVQVQDMEFGRGKELIDAEVLITVDSAPDKVIALRLHEDSPPISAIMANTLRDAYINNKNVTVYYQMTPVYKKHVKLLMVQMN